MKLTFGGRSFFALCVFALSQVGCSYAIDKNNSQESPDQSATALGASASYQTIHDRVFAPRCIQCHGSSGGVNLESYNSVVQNLDRCF
jgi:mono/diheme cytochrome c family protein